MANGWGPPNYVCCGCLDLGKIPKWKLIHDEDEPRYQQTGWKKCDDIIHDDANNTLHGKERNV